MIALVFLLSQKLKKHRWFLNFYFIEVNEMDKSCKKHPNQRKWKILSSTFFFLVEPPSESTQLLSLSIYLSISLSLYLYLSLNHFKNYKKCFLFHLKNLPVFKIFIFRHFFLVFHSLQILKDQMWLLKQLETTFH